MCKRLDYKIWVVSLLTFTQEARRNLAWLLGNSQRYYLSLLGDKPGLHLHRLHWFVTKSAYLGYYVSFAKGSLLISRMFSFFFFFKFNTFHLSLLWRICRKLGTYKDSFGISLKFRTAHHLLSLGLTPMQSHPRVCLWCHSTLEERGSLRELGSFG